MRSWFAFLILVRLLKQNLLVGAAVVRSGVNQYTKDEEGEADGNVHSDCEEAVAQ